MEEIKAITTYYNGYKFRSRLEARWAVFFDTAKIRYEYEPEGFRLKNGLCYLPDFYLPDENMYVEVKPPRKGAWKDIDKAGRFIGNGIDTLLILPNIPDRTDSVWYFPVLYWHSVEQAVKIKWCPFLSVNIAESAYLDRGMPDPSNYEDQFFPAFNYLHEEQAEKETGRILQPKRDESEDSRATYIDFEDEKLLMSIWDKARQARFEHGEKG